jgi:hypothetical protein
MSSEVSPKSAGVAADYPMLKILLASFSIVPECHPKYDAKKEVGFQESPVNARMRIYASSRSSVKSWAPTETLLLFLKNL